MAPDLPPRQISSPRRRRAGVAAALVTAVLLAGPARAAPVAQDDAPRAPDPYELAARWTLASLPAAIGGGTPLAALQALPPAAAAPAGAATAPRFTALPMAAGEPGVPDPGSYALMGLLLLVAGLAVHQLRRGRAAGQRGFSKKT
jgi:hypothetical protein